MKFLVYLSPYLFLLFIELAGKAYAQCPDYSWIVELHSKRRAINCQSSANQISEVFESIISALQSGRSVEIEAFGQFTIEAKKTSAQNSQLPRKLKRLHFKPSNQLSQQINESIPKMRR